MKMGRFIMSLSLLTIFVTGCTPSQREMTFLQPSGKQKAIVAVMPVLSRVDNRGLSWNLSEEFTSEICSKVADSAKIYLLRERSTREIAERLNTPNPAMIPASETKDLGAAEFVVVSELLDQHESPRNANSTTLNLSMRVRLLDIRQEQPKVILQEVLNHKQVVDYAFMNTDYESVQWGSEAYHHTPMGVAHNRLVRKLVSRVESYVEAAR